MIAFITVFLAVILGVYLYLDRMHSYWKRKGIAQLTPEFLFGNFKNAVLAKTFPSQVIVDSYYDLKKMGVQHGGIYYLYSPIWLPVDPKLIKQLLFQDYWSFVSHGYLYRTKEDVLTNNLFNVDEGEWKRLRSKLSPTFSTGKLKLMFDIFDILGDRLTKKVEELYEQKQPLDVKEVTACFGTDIIANCAFGIECNTLDDPKNDFRKYGKMIFTPRPVKDVIERFFNWNLLSFFGYKWMPKSGNNFFLNLVKEMVEYREKNNITRNDYLQLLIQLKNRGSLSEEGKSDDGEGGFSLDDIAANVFIMYAAGFETTSTTITFLMFELAKNPDIQEKLREEILRICKNDPNHKLTYEDLLEMKYCEMCINETLRLHSVAAEVPRKCTTAYKIPGTDQVIEKGTLVFMPSWAIHKDPEYYQNPEEFNPENFSEEAKAARKDFVFFPFGDGPRLCIGARFAILEAKVAMVKYLRKFRYTLNPKTSSSIKYDANSFTLMPKGDIFLDIHSLK